MSENDFDDELIGPEEFIGPSAPRPSSSGDLYREPKEKKSAELFSLIEWTSKWEYQPGCQYVKLSREFPKTWEGLPIGGFLEDVYEPFDQDYIFSRWGGGTYRLHAIQLDPDGKSRTADRKTCTLSGLPLSMRGADGEPTRLPQPRNVEETMRRRMREDDEWEDEDERRRGGTPSAVDLYYAASQNQGPNVSPEMLDVMRQSQNDSYEHMQKTMEATQRLNEQTIANQDRELERMREQMREQERSAQQPFNYAMQMMESRSQSEMTNMRSQLDAMRDQHQSQLQMIQSEHSRVVESYQRELDRMRDDSRLREDQVRSMVQGQYQGQIAALENRALMAEQNAQRNVEMARQDADRREQQMKLMLESGFDSKFQFVIAEKNRLESELATTRQELSEFRAIAMETKDPITQMAKIKEFINVASSFTPEAPSSGDDVPDDMVGKIAHYGPGFAKNFLAPILNRVDAATEVATRQISAQEQQNALIRQHQQNYQAQLPGPSRTNPVQVNQPVYNTPGYAEQQSYQTPEPAYQAPEPSYGAPEPDLPTKSFDGVSEGLQRLVEHLDEKLEEDTSSSDVADELRTGVTFGVIPQEIYDGFVSRPPQESLQEIITAAQIMGKLDLASPRGMKFSQEILANLQGGEV
tara:strand:- start:1019 stop:2932 length:1914 start_codon:yes stop_codon:yes gene_type:complete